MFTKLNSGLCSQKKVEGADLGFCSQKVTQSLVAAHRSKPKLIVVYYRLETQHRISTM